MLRDRYPFYLANAPQQPNADLVVTDKYSGKPATRVALAGAEHIEKAIAAAQRAAPAMARFPAFKRQAVLRHCARQFSGRQQELALSLCIEAGKPIKDSRGEVTRLIDTFNLAADECSRDLGGVMSMDVTERSQGYRGMHKRVPIGPLSLISPFNFPLNLAAHKVAPAIAAGCPFVLKPASRTPIGALIIGEVLAQTDLPKGAFSILPCSRDGADLFTTDERFKLLSFTGSPKVGWDLKARAGRKRVVLELGGNAACIVTADADVEKVIPRLVFGAYYQSGQSCISVQRILIHSSRYAQFRDKLTAAVEALVHGDPQDEKTTIGPMISEDEARRLEGWIEEAIAKGARKLCGGPREGSMLRASLLENVPSGCKLDAEEAFGPVATLAPYEDFDDALDRVNDTKYGLQAGVFTRDIDQAMKAWDRLEVGGVIIGDVPSWRVDHMPYGGVKESGLGREGVRYAIEDMTEHRLLVIRDPA
ncbi:succinate semialdehyde dehydrogenase [Panacagrimonas perspica]|uniref:Succinate semialdehyde dehydrogenase n=1 Tax=Panacagrimonas perspica TaxID=381431 RepID=A0A4R7PDH8_9GAMM|nr:aldehyde dehydrogenase family protein [Panacagrimonas perspica]TDU32137.1 succinate semialdehyde dehydrogenase [Panacagrimonas perspica]THD01158.1 aldehyde dehydrogenase [Panacagrimonas perspica]